MTKPPRKRFQFHLSTAIVMMVVAGALIWANTIKNESYLEFTNYGWPMQMVTLLKIREHAIIGLESPTPKFIWLTHYNYTAVIVNIVIAANVLYAAYSLCEYLIRRWAAQKEA